MKLKLRYLTCLMTANKLLHILYKIINCKNKITIMAIIIAPSFKAIWDEIIMSNRKFENISKKYTHPQISGQVYRRLLPQDTIHIFMLRKLL